MLDAGGDNVPPKDPIDYGTGEGAAYGGNDADSPIFIAHPYPSNTAGSESHEKRHTNEKHKTDILYRARLGVGRFFRFIFSNATAWNAIASVIIAFATIVYVGYAHRQWVVMSGQLENMKGASTQAQTQFTTTNNNAIEYNEKQLRAYVLSTGSPRVILNTDKTVNISVELKNYGATTANRITYARIAFVKPQGKKPHDQFHAKIWGETSADDFHLGSQQTACITWKRIIPDASQLRGRPNPLLYIGIELQYQDVYSGCKFNAVGYTTEETVPNLAFNKPLGLDYAFGWDDNNADTDCRKRQSYGDDYEIHGPRGDIPNPLRAPAKERRYPDPLEATVKIGPCPWSKTPR